MNQIVLIMENTTIYWYSVILAMAALSGICFFLACCQHARISSVCAATAVLLSLVLSLLISRLLYWYSRADSFQNLVQALTTPASGRLTLTGAFLGCGLTVLLLGYFSGKLLPLLDCLSVAGCGAIALGRLGNFFTASDRGQIVTELTNLPWAYPVINAASGLPEYRIATFLFQAIIAGVLFAVLAWLFFRKSGRHIPYGDVTILFLLVYCASQVLLDSTRYDSLYFRSNGFVSVVQVFSAFALAATIVFFSIRAVKSHGLKKWMIVCWVFIAGLFGIAGYMEYFVQRHGKLAFFSYAVMEHCLIGIVVLTILFWRSSLKSDKSHV